LGHLPAPRVGAWESGKVGEWECKSARVRGDSALTLSHSHSLTQLQQAFGYTNEDLKILMSPMAADGNEAIGSMGNDAALAVLSDRPQLLYNYFKQLFAQVTNPPVDGIREEIIMSMETTIGAEANLLRPTPGSARHIKLKSPILRNEELDKLRQLDGTWRPGGARPLMPGRF